MNVHKRRIRSEVALYAVGRDKGKETNEYVNILREQIIDFKTISLYSC